MKVALIGSAERQKKFGSEIDIKGVELVSFGGQVSAAELLKKASDAEYIIVDAISAVSAEMMDAMPNLKLIHSEGVGYNKIDVKAASERGIHVCNNKGINAAPVAEHALMLMLAVTKDIVRGKKAVLCGRQIEDKSAKMLAGFKELSEYRIGLIGLGDIGKALANMLRPIGPEVFYYKRNRLSTKEENALNVCYLSLDDLLKKCDIISLHLPVNENTAGMVNAEFLGKMQDDSFLINTSRGELMVNEDVIEALKNGKLAGAGLDTIAPEPVLLDNPFLSAPSEVLDKLVITPHIAGVTGGTFKRAYKQIWENIFRVADGKEPINCVNKEELK